MACEQGHLEDDLFVKRKEGNPVDKMHETYNTLDPKGNMVSGMSSKLPNDAYLGIGLN